MALDFNNLGFDFEQAEEASKGSFAPLPEGEYTLILKNVTEKIAKTGIAGRGFEFTVIDPEAYINRVVFKDAWLESKEPEKMKTMFGMFAGFLNSCGVSKEARELLFKAGYPAPALFVELSEKQYVVKLGLKDHQGNTYNEIKKVISVKEAGASF
jgi:hypothetical protein